MDIQHKKTPSNTRKTVALLGKIVLVLMGKPIPVTQTQPLHIQNKAHQQNRSALFKFSILLLKLPLLFLIAALKKQKPYVPTAYEKMAGERLPSGRYYVPDDKLNPPRV